MRGKTKSFFEDISIITIVIGIIYGIYYFYSSFGESTKSEEIITIPKVKKEPIQLHNIIKSKNNKTITTKIKLKIEPKSTIKKEPKIKQEVKTSIHTILKKTKIVDLKMLRAFLIETQYNIRKNLIYPQNIIGSQGNNFLKIKITILKNGTCERVQFVSGNKKMFILNEKNILKVFPLTIDKKISDDFPRYLRMNIKINNN